ncbi:DDE-type integrase/transposase/recombinase [Deinococcus detaillensis]|uniref:DDE-type integrase/transposase/recombinase n=1 Tax=Deinococcus detaillensis TaxID=2592048 RepID=A0A553UZ76_9DEIO|nr:DDE-type integrase/transposase/recombinase [Deinococcus detaillensis]
MMFASPPNQLRQREMLKLDGQCFGFLHDLTWRRRGKLRHDLATRRLVPLPPSLHLGKVCRSFCGFDALKQVQPHRDEVYTTVDGVRHWLWRAVDEYGFVLDILLQRHRNTKAAKTFLTRLLGEYDVPEVIRTDQLQSYGAAIRQIPSLADVDHQEVISKARCNNIVEQEHRSTRRQERSQQGFRRQKRAQEFLSLHAWITNLHHHSRTSVSAAVRRSDQKRAFQTWSTVAAGVA